MTNQIVFAALADPTRRAIFEHIARKPAPVGEVAKTLPVSRPAVSQHLKVLSDAGLVSVEIDGTRRIYAANRARLRALRDWVDAMWDDALGAFSEAAKKETKP